MAHNSEIIASCHVENSEISPKQRWNKLIWWHRNHLTNSSTSSQHSLPRYLLAGTYCFPCYLWWIHLPCFQVGSAQWKRHSLWVKMGMTFLKPSKSLAVTHRDTLATWCEGLCSLHRQDTLVISINWATFGLEIVLNKWPWSGLWGSLIHHLWMCRCDGGKQILGWYLITKLGSLYQTNLWNFL